MIVDWSVEAEGEAHGHVSRYIIIQSLVYGAIGGVLKLARLLEWRELWKTVSRVRMAIHLGEHVNLARLARSGATGLHHWRLLRYLSRFVSTAAAALLLRGRLWRF